MNILSIVNKVKENFCTRIYGNRQELDKLMNQLDEYRNMLSYGLIENSTGLFVEVVLYEEL